jgi:membrane-bound lytic murein transglycosylase D
MNCIRLFTVLTTIVGGLGVLCAQATDYNGLYKNSVKEIGVQPDTIKALSAEELALLVEYIPNEPNEVIQDRLSCIESEIPLQFNNFVRSHIDYFTIRNRKYTRMMLTRHNVYFPLFERYLQKYNMPQDLKYLAIVESGLKPTAKSHAAAVGLWQFISSTGKEYGLNQNKYIDERMDPEKSTDAALRFLRRLYTTYGDWELAMAAYNCGQGNVNKAIRKAGGGTKTFWEIFPYLPRETRSYVPNMTAVIYTMNYASEHNIFSDSLLYEPKVAILEVNQALDIDKLAKELHTSPENLMALNPELQTRQIPEHLRNYKLRIPAERAPLLASTFDKECILLAAAPLPTQVLPDQVKPQVLLAVAKTEKEVVKPTPSSTTETEKTDKITYSVQRGDNLTMIATRYNVTIEQIKEWNGLASSNINYGQPLIVFQPSSKASPALIATAKEQSDIVSKKVAIEKKTQQEQMIYHVQPGDTLWNISQRHDGITVEQIRKLNKLRTDNIKPGQKLILS